MNSTKVLALAESYIAAFGWPSRDRAAEWLAGILRTTIDAQVLADRALADGYRERWARLLAAIEEPEGTGIDDAIAAIGSRKSAAVAAELEARAKIAEKLLRAALDEGTVVYEATVERVVAAIRAHGEG